MTPKCCGQFMVVDILPNGDSVLVCQKCDRQIGNSQMSELLTGRALDAAIDRARGRDVRGFGKDYVRWSVTLDRSAESVRAYSTDDLAAEKLLQQCMRIEGVREVRLRCKLVVAGCSMTIVGEHGINFRGEGATWAEAKSRACLALLEARKGRG